MQHPNPHRFTINVARCALLIGISLAWLPACARRSPSAGAPTEPATPPVAPEHSAPATPEQEDGSSVDAQVARGQALFGQHCAKCHGADGTGASGPAVVGAGALAEFGTAAEVFAFADAKMPGDAPGSLPDQDMLAILAFDLHANGVELTEPLSPENAGAIRLGAP